MKVLLVAGCCAGAVLAAPAGALADETIYAGPPSQYFTTSVSPDQGEPVEFTNVDVVDHDVVAVDKGPDGNPLFRSELVARGGSSPVAGTEFLKTGAYEFFCSLHATMKGTLNVTSAGTPKERPGSAPPSSPPPSSPPPSSPSPASQQSGDSTPPSVRIGIADRRLSVVRRRRGLRIQIRTDEPITIGLVVKSGRTTIGTGTFDVQAGGRTVTVKLRRRAGKRLTVQATAADGAGNGTRGSTRRTLR